MTMDEAKVAKDVDAYIETGIRDLKATIAELEKIPYRERFRTDSCGLCPESELNMARHRLATLEESKERRARS